MLRPDDTLRMLEPHLSKLGITRVADLTGLDCVGIPTVMVVHPNARSTSVSHGHGPDLIAAKAAAVMEALERHHAEHVVRALRLCSASELSAEAEVIAIDRVPRVARGCNARERILWTEGRTFDGETAIWVPFELVHLDLRVPAPAGSGFFATGATGLASGNTFEEAVVHGACELIEQDALTLFQERSLAEQARRRLDLTSVDDPFCGELIERFARAGLQLAAWDLTSDLRVASFLCAVAEEPARAFRAVGVAHGLGCHPSRAVALAHALCEAAEDRIVRLAGVRDDGYAAEHGAMSGLAVLERHHEAFEPGSPTPTRFRDVPTFEGGTFAEDIGLLRQRTEMAEVSLAVVDLSRAQQPAHVVRVVAAGLEPNAQYAECGRRARVRSERERGAA